MRINSLSIKNFRSYRGVTDFDFNIEDNKNIILIGGENGAGKSSIFEAIRLCLYGPLTYKYQGMVSAYISRVKDMINEDAYLDEEVESYILMDIDMDNADSTENYVIKRRWTFDDTRLVEEFIVKENGVFLEKDQSDEFLDYFKSVIPPTVFDLSFFDGEKLFEFFEERLNGQRLRETVLTLNNLDVFGLLSRELVLNARRKNREQKNLKEETIELENIEKELAEEKEDLAIIIDQIKEDLEMIDKISIEINNKKQDFINSGGLDQERRDDLVSEISKYESERDRINQDIKTFSNDSLPFLILMDELESVEKQIKDEEEFILYDAMKDRMDIDNITNKLSKKGIKSDNLESIVSEIEKIIISNEFDIDFKPIHYLSKEQLNKVLLKINEVKNIDSKEIDFFDRIEHCTKRISENRQILRGSMDIDEEKKYINEINDLKKEVDERHHRVQIYKIRKEEKENLIERKHKELVRLNEKIDLIKKVDNINDISNEIIEMTDELLVRITKNKRKDISNHFNEVFAKIIRKDRFIDYIDLDDEFDVNLYIKKEYRIQELVHMTANLGINILKDKLGDKFIQEITGKKEATRVELLNELNLLNSEDRIDLSTKIDLMKLSSGEKQIYILCLYWALIKTANVSIPFVIDTPYGRIDKEHRSAMTNEYLPNISHQVIILSTNTEIEENLYREIEKYVSKEYTLNYNMNTRATKVESGYFYEVKK